METCIRRGLIKLPCVEQNFKLSLFYVFTKKTTSRIQFYRPGRHDVVETKYKGRPFPPANKRINNNNNNNNKMRPNDPLVHFAGDRL